MLYETPLSGRRIAGIMLLSSAFAVFVLAAMPLVHELLGWASAVPKEITFPFVLAKAMAALSIASLTSAVLVYWSIRRPVRRLNGGRLV